MCSQLWEWLSHMTTETIPPLKSRSEVKLLWHLGARCSPGWWSLGNMRRDGGISFPSSLQLVCTSQILLAMRTLAQPCFLLGLSHIEFNDSTDSDFYKSFTKKKSAAEQSCVFSCQEIRLWLILLLIFGPVKVLIHLYNPRIVPALVSCQPSSQLW